MDFVGAAVEVVLGVRVRVEVVVELCSRNRGLLKINRAYVSNLISITRGDDVISYINIKFISKDQDGQ